MGSSRPTSPAPSVITVTNDSDDDFLTEDEEVNQRLAVRRKKKETGTECFMTGIADYGITKTMERAAG